jgi:hypothetical protein
MKEINRQLKKQEYLKYIKQWKIDNKRLIDSGECRKVFLECLPRWGVKEGNGRIGTINWNESISKKIHFIYNKIEGDLELLNYCNRKIYVKYKNYNEKAIYSKQLITCSFDKLLNIKTKEFKIEIGTIFKDEKRDITITNRKYRRRNRKDGKKEFQKFYQFQCNKCGWTEGWIEESRLLGVRKGGCACCAGKTVVEGINDIPTTAPELIPYFQGGYDEAKLYTKCGGGNPNNPRGYIYAICPKCFKKSKMLISIYNIYKHEGFGCVCSDSISYPNKFAFNMLKQLNLDFKTEYSPSWIKPKRYDFYFIRNSKKYILEMDGGLGHGKENKLSSITAQESKKIDNYKDEQARLHGIEVIRIDCDYKDFNDRFNYIKQNILNSELSQFFNLNSVNWIKIDELACSSMIKDICDLWNSGINNTNDISKITKIARGTVIRYLTQGSLLNWCTYNAKEETLKGSSYSGKLKGKKVIIFIDDTLIKVFNSAHELDKQSEKLFGVKLNYSCICKIARAEKESYKGFKFNIILITQKC